MIQKCMPVGNLARVSETQQLVSSLCRFYRCTNIEYRTRFCSEKFPQIYFFRPENTRVERTEKDEIRSLFHVLTMYVRGVWRVYGPLCHSQRGAFSSCSRETTTACRSRLRNIPKTAIQCLPQQTHNFRATQAVQQPAAQGMHTLI